MTKKELAHIAKVMYDLQEYCEFNFGDIEKHAKNVQPTKRVYVNYSFPVTASLKCGKSPKQTLSDWSVKAMKIGAKAKVIDWRSVYAGEVVELIEETNGSYVFTNAKHKRGTLTVNKSLAQEFISWERDSDGK